GSFRGRDWRGSASGTVRYLDRLSFAGFPPRLEADQGDAQVNAKPKTLLYADALAKAERRIVDALPEIVDGLIAQAQAGDVRAAPYLLDRILGRSAPLATPPADDRRAPYTDEDFALDLEEREEDREQRRTLASLFGGGGSSGARKGT